MLATDNDPVFDCFLVISDRHLLFTTTIFLRMTVQDCMLMVG